MVLWCFFQSFVIVCKGIYGVLVGFYNRQLRDILVAKARAYEHPFDWLTRFLRLCNALVDLAQGSSSSLWTQVSLNLQLFVNVWLFVND